MKIPSLTTSHMPSLLRQLYFGDRYVQKTRVFCQPARISFLSFLGASEFFITEFGHVFQRSRIRPNSYGIQTSRYQPLAWKDPHYRTPWVYLKTTFGMLWFPLNQLLGWAFFPPQRTDAPYYVSDTPYLLPVEEGEYSWREKVDLHPDSYYVHWMHDLLAS